jgi:hypothetical protein
MSDMFAALFPSNEDSTLGRLSKAALFTKRKLRTHDHMRYVKFSVYSCLYFSDWGVSFASSSAHEGDELPSVPDSI